MRTESQPLVGVVTPVYNEAEHIAECIESVLAQTYQNWEYTIADNCSTDGTAEIAQRYAERDPRISVVRNPQFLRVTANFNSALRQIPMNSKYCKIVLGDDWIFPECLERMVAVAEQYPNVAIVAAYALAGADVKWTGLPYPSTCVPGREVCRRTLLENLTVFGSENSVLYRADVVRSRNPFYNEGNVHADTETCFDLLRTYDFGFVHQVLTFTRVRPGSLSRISADLHTDYGGILQNIVKYGPHFLSEQELADCRERFVKSYYKFLGKSVFLGRNKSFWDFHQTKLKESGVDFSQARMVGAIGVEAFRSLLNPLQLTKRGTRFLNEIVQRRKLTGMQDN